ncbi:MAG: hypothetical protein K5871_07040 [Lachnospiraceae bacterium]|nr:hypothetical protein [Lachnospiraceae bacterium]
MQASIFFGSFFSYLLLMVIIVCVAALGFAVGRVLRKGKDGRTENVIASDEGPGNGESN